MNFLKRDSIKNGHVLTFCLLLLAWWLVYWSFIIAKFHYSVTFLIIFTMGFLSFWLIRELPKWIHTDRGARG